MSKKCICQECGKEFMSRDSHITKFCSDECRKKHRRENSKGQILNCTCYFCGKKFHKVPSAIKDRNFCSRKCQNSYFAKMEHDKAWEYLNCTCENCGKLFHRSDSKNTKRTFCNNKCYQEFLQKNRVYVNCKYCGKEFILNKSAVKENNFCSKDCHDNWQRRFQVKMNCATCGKEIMVDRARYEKTMAKTGKFFCCNACIGKYFRGKKSPTYKNGTSTFHMLLRYYYERYQRHLAYQKHGKVCVVCGKEADELHHKIRLADMRDEFLTKHSITIEEADKHRFMYFEMFKREFLFTRT